MDVDLSYNWKFKDLNEDLQVFLNETKDRCLKEEHSFRFRDLRHEKYTAIDRDMKLSEQGLKQCIKWKKDGEFKLDVNGELYGSQHRMQYMFTTKEKQKIQNKVKNQFNYKWSSSGIFMIPSGGGFFGWHTNSDKTFPRIYFVWAEKENSSWFYIYRNGKINVVNEPKGWSINMFQPPDWHSGKSDCIRISIGFRQLKGEAIWLDQEK
jgi:hypothetical protein